MTDPATSPPTSSGGTAGPAGTSWRKVNLVLIAVVLLLIVSSVLLFAMGAAATPGDSRAEALSREYNEVTKAAREETLAILTVDYKNMDPLIAKITSGATGTFKEQYERTKPALKARAQELQSVATGEVKAVGIGDLDADTAIVLVAANGSVSNKFTKGKAQPGVYRFKLTMVHKGDKWLTSDLQILN